MTFAILIDAPTMSLACIGYKITSYVNQLKIESFSN